MKNLLYPLLLGSLCATLVPTAALAQERTNPFAAAMAAFQMRVNSYIDLHDKVAKDAPKITDTNDPAKISSREKALGTAIALQRKTAKAGDVFGDLSPYIQQILAKDWMSRSEADRRALFAEIPPNLVLAVNQPYPTSIPFVTVPARLLAALPTLPEAVEYRLIERRLLLRDRDANLIIDVLVGVPPKKGSR